jgi:hypothetical protein
MRYEDSSVPLAEGLEDLELHGAREEFRQLCVELGANDLPDRTPY